MQGTTGPFDLAHAPPIGQPETLAPGLRVVTAPNPGPMTFTGTRSYVLQDQNGNIELTHSISAGLDYAAVGPEHAWLHDTERAEYAWIDDADALAAFQRLGREEGILPALESSHAVAHACRIAPAMAGDERLVDKSIVMAGGVTSANFPAVVRKSRRSNAAGSVSASLSISTNVFVS